MKQFKLLLLASMVMLFTACGGGGSSVDSTLPIPPESTVPINPDTPQTIAIDKIMLYADDNTQPVPTIQDYEDAGVVGVTSENIDDVNSVVASLTHTDVDTTEEIQKIVDDLGINILPTANAGPDMSVEVNQEVTITGSGTDIDGTIASYAWTKNAVVIADTASFDYVPITVGTDTLTLTVTDDDGGTASDSMNVTVAATPGPDTTPPVITILGDNPELVIQDESYTDAGATALDDRDGDVDVITAGSVDTSIIGNYTITYTAEDSADNVATAARTVSVVSLIDATPTANAGIDIYTIQEAIITLDGSASTDDETIVLYEWFEGITKLGEGVTLEINPTDLGIGEHNITLKVTDDDNLNDTDMLKVTIRKGIKKTGQIKSYDENGNEVTDGSIKDDGYYQSGITPSYARDDIKKVVTDNLTGLMWQDDEVVRMTWEGTSIVYEPPPPQTYCANLELGGYTDWRLPNPIELQSIVLDSSRPSIDITVFKNVASDNYWADGYPSFDFVYIVGFWKGFISSTVTVDSFTHLPYSYYVRCVRGGE